MPLQFEPQRALDRLFRDEPRSMVLSQTARAILEARYLRRDADGHVTETPEGMIQRVGAYVAQAEQHWNGDCALWSEVFSLVMLRQEFLPNSPTLMNARGEKGQLSACFVLPAMSPQTDTLQEMLRIHKTGGGTGFNLTPLSPFGSTDPMERLGLLDEATGLAAGEDPRRGANMAVLSVEHPAILRFATAKLVPGALENFNLSVAVFDAFMEAVQENLDQDLRDPVSGQRIAKLNARDILAIMALSAWASGDPGILYQDRIERDNPTPHLGRLDTTNPCGELPLLPYEACTLGSINLAKFTKAGEIDWQALAETVWIATRFLDDVIEVNKFPVEEIERRSRATRKIGIGVMGFADMLVDMDIPYDSTQAVQWADRIMDFISREARTASQVLAHQRGPFPEFPASVPAAKGEPPTRHATRLSIAPTGTISLIAGCSAGIEPYFALAMQRRALDGRTFQEIVSPLEPAIRRWGLPRDEILPEVLATGRLPARDDIPPTFRAMFRTAQEIGWKQHIEIQAAFQRHVDNSVSKTINLPEETGPDEIYHCFLWAHRKQCKGVTVYRQGSKPRQVLVPGTASAQQQERRSGGLGTKANTPEPGQDSRQTNCPRCGESLKFAGPFSFCLECAWSSFDRNIH